MVVKQGALLHMHKIKSYIITALYLFIPCYTAAAVSIDMKLNRHEISLVDTVDLTVSVSGTRSSENPRIKGLKGFVVEQGGTSSQMQIVNGKISSSVVYKYYLQPKKIGSYKIGPAVVKVDGKVISSGVENLTVKKSAVKRSTEESPIFLNAALSSGNAYVEEQLLYTLRLYYSTNISNVSLSKIEVQDLALTQLGKAAEYRSKFGNKNYNVIEVKFALTSSKPGKYNIHPAKMSMSVPRQRGGRGRYKDPFDDFFTFSRGRTITVASEALNLEVIPVPEKGKTPDFSGLIGTYIIESLLEPETVKAGESATLTITIRGRGNVNRIPDLNIPEIFDIKIYSDEPSLQTEQSDLGIDGIKTMKWAIVPKKEGKYRIPPFSLNYFDTKKNSYANIKTSEYQLSVLPGAVDKETLDAIDRKYSSRSEKQLVEELGKDILPIHSSITGISSNTDFVPQWFSWILILFPAFIYGGFIGFFRLSRKTPEQLVQVKANRASKALLEKFKDQSISSANALNVLREYINNRFNLEFGIITPGDASGILRDKGCSDESAEQMKSLLQSLENSIYTGKGEDTFKSDIGIVKLVNTIEKEIK